ncbi:hypothetical protein FKM82_029751 [Ascaphus truei]
MRCPACSVRWICSRTPARRYYTGSPSSSAACDWAGPREKPRDPDTCSPSSTRASSSYPRERLHKRHKD